jgi:diketogulonate reductase-like aldo/keto reductase
MEYPIINFGTYRLKELEIPVALETALKVGYRSIDTASLYLNEQYIGKFIKENEITRSSLWITSKLNPKIVSKSPDTIIKSIKTTLENLQTDYLDLFLLHAPSVDNMEKCWSVLENFKRQGIFRNIGVSNFKPEHIEQILKFSSEPIFTNQIELSPFLTRQPIVKYMREKSICISAHSSLAKGEKFDNLQLINVSNKYLKTPAQIMLKWAIQNNYNVIPRSGNPIHIKEDFDLDFVIEPNDIELLNSLNSDYYTHPQYK